jgi:hypothetical protein
MDGLTAVKHIRQEEAAGSLASNLVIALSRSFLVEKDCRLMSSWKCQTRAD